MQQTLIRILLTDWFRVESREGTWHLGVGFILIPWIVLGLLEIRSAMQKGESLRQQAGSLFTWALIAVGILAVPLFANQLPQDSVPVFGWGFMLVLGFLSAGMFTIRRAERIGIPKELIWDLGMYIFASGIVGARLFFLVQYRRVVFRDVTNFGQFLQAALNFSDGGMVLYGGVLLGMVVYIWFCRTRQIPALVLADLVIPAIFIGLAFGRLGCLLNGCCYGDVCELPWSIQFPPGSPPYDALLNRGFLEPGAEKSLPLHPTQIYSSLNAFLLAALSAVWFKRRTKDGEVVVLALLTYPVMRFTIEFLRNDEFGQFRTGLTISQLVSIGLFSLGILLLVYLRHARGSTKTPLPLKIAPPEKNAQVPDGQPT
ncbi:MAG: prolipoprotein diacylglyceryl transferase [Planctomycetaceae bacterium]|nr:prolipoprotein diacylglyceryl transferase [Planctomycetaceae bacterium]